MKKLTLLLAMGALLIAGCTDFKEIQISELTDKQRQEKRSDMSEEEDLLLKGYLRRKADTTVTVAEAIKLQRNWEDEKAKSEAIAKEKAEKKAQEKAEAERIAKEKIEQINKIVGINIFHKDYQNLEVRRRETPFNVFFFDATNNSNKPISKYRATITIKDTAGHILDKAIIEKETPIAPQATVRESFAIEASRASVNEVKIQRSDLKALQFDINFNFIIYADGTRNEILTQE